MESEVFHSLPGSWYAPSTAFHLAAGVQVRREKFGLLFYDYRGPRLYFVPSKDLIDERFFEGQQPLGDLVAAVAARCGLSRPEVTEHLAHTLQKLQDKGLIHGQSIR